MKNILKILSLLLISSFMLSSCIDDETRTDDYAATPNLMSFSKAKVNATIIADGSTATQTISLLLKGPTIKELSEDVTAMIEIDQSSTAIEGTHYAFGTKEVLFTKANDYTATVDFTILSAGIASPSAVNLVLNIIDASNGNIIRSGRTGQTDVTIGYLCPSNLAGDYTNPAINASDANGHGIVTETGPGQYTIDAMPSISYGGTGRVYINIMENCGVITVIGGELDNNFGAHSEGIGALNEDGSFHFDCQVYKSDGSLWFDISDSTYTPF